MGFLEGGRTSWNFKTFDSSKASAGECKLLKKNLLKNQFEDLLICHITLASKHSGSIFCIQIGLNKDYSEVWQENLICSCNELHGFIAVFFNEVLSLSHFRGSFTE